jgi:hypothetical protein
MLADIIKNISNKKNMTILKKGITGFDKPKEINEHSIAEIENLIKNIKYPFVKSGEIKKPNESSNYFRISLINQIENNRFDILINIYYWIISSVKTENSWMNLEFLEVDNQLITQILNFRSEILILNVDVLNQKASKIEMENLGKIEIENIEYWDSETYGEIIFNGYD